MIHDCNGSVIHALPTAAYGVANTMGAVDKYFMPIISAWVIVVVTLIGNITTFTLIYTTVASSSSPPPPSIIIIIIIITQ
jgi:predicted membrane protein